MNERFTPQISKQTPGSKSIYLDHHATTPVDPRVLAVAVRMMVEDYGNANGVENTHGENAAGVVDNAKEKVARLLAAEPEDVHFTSGSTEAIQLAISHAIASHKAPLRVALTGVEHKAVIDTVLRAEQMGLVEKSWVAVDSRAQIDMESLESVLADGVDLVCIMAANNEVGTIYPVLRIAQLARNHDADVLVDATQAVGRVPLDLSDGAMTYLVLSAHKIYGPKGVGALVSSSFDRSSSFGLQGAHEATPNVAGIAAMGVACEILEMESAEENKRLSSLRDRLQERLCTLIPDLVVNGDQANRLPNNLHVTVKGAPNDIVLSRL